MSVALSNTINLLRRAGRLDEVPDILAEAEKDRRSGGHAGVCKRSVWVCVCEKERMGV